jgi:F0F1-type ATP synthase membrane subunit b/b'
VQAAFSTPPPFKLRVPTSINDAVAQANLALDHIIEHAPPSMKEQLEQQRRILRESTRDSAAAQAEAKKIVKQGADALFERFGGRLNQALKDSAHKNSKTP